MEVMRGNPCGDEWQRQGRRTDYVLRMLATRDKQFVMMRGIAHVAVLGIAEHANRLRARANRARAFSSEVAAGSRRENASKQKPRARFGFHQKRKSSGTNPTRIFSASIPQSD
jgi:hypothetical protein